MPYERQTTDADFIDFGAIVDNIPEEIFIPPVWGSIIFILFCFFALLFVSKLITGIFQVYEQ